VRNECKDHFYIAKALPFNRIIKRHRSCKLARQVSSSSCVAVGKQKKKEKMDGLSNAFSVLEIDAEDDRLQSASAASPVKESTCSATPGFTLSIPFLFPFYFLFFLFYFLVLVITLTWSLAKSFRVRVRVSAAARSRKRNQGG
jgi:hypothetical protein